MHSREPDELNVQAFSTGRNDKEERRSAPLYSAFFLKGPHSSSASFTDLRRGLADKRIAGNIGVPVHKRAVRILLPGPDMQRVEGRKPEAIGGLEVMEDLSHQHG